MKKLSLLFVFVVLAVAIFAITAFAAQSNIANQAEVSTTTGCWVSKNYISALIDGNREKGTASSYSDKAVSYTLTYNQDVFIEQLVIVVNGKGRTYDDGKGGGIFEEVTNYNFPLTIKLTNSAGDVVYEQAHQTGDKTEIAITPNASVCEITLTITCNWNSNCNIWEVEAFGHVCSYTELVEETPAPTCMDTGLKILGCSECDSTKKEIIPAIGSHTWDEGVITTDPTEATEGVKTYTCTVCKSTKTERVQPIGHNWDEGTVVAPSCTEGGYTIYKCTDEGCDKSYTIAPTDALGHDYESVITVAPTLTKEGEKLLTCKREGCGHSKTEVVPVATMSDSSFIIGLDNIVSFKEVIEGPAHENRNWQHLFDGNNANTSSSQSNPAGWFGKPGSTLSLVFDEEYYILSATFYAWSNYASFTIDFIGADGSTVATHSGRGYQDTNIAPHAIDVCVDKYVKSIKITINDAKYDYGNGLAFQELIFTAHKHLAEGENAKYDEVVGCVDNGSYKKFCYVCEKEVLVETKPSGIHDLSTDITFPKGFDMNGSVSSTCSRCDYSEKQRLKPIFYSYGYSVREDGGAITHRIEIDLEALAAYESYAKAPLVFGTVAAATPNFEGAPIEVVDGTVVGTSSRVSVKTLSGLGYVSIENRIANIPEFAYDTEVVLCPFIYDGKSISYINANKDSGAEFETVTYNNLLQN